MSGKIEEYTRLLADESISNADRYRYEQELERVTAQKRIADEEKRAAEAAAAAEKKAA